MSAATQLLASLTRGDPRAGEELLTVLYDELRALAAAKLAREKPGQTLQPTALVHEAYLRLVGGTGTPPQWEGRRHFFSAAAEAMRRILVENARRKKAAKHDNADFARDAMRAIEGPSDDVLAVHDALDELARTDATSAELVKLHFFSGFTLEETAEVLGLSARTARRQWAFARTWLFRRLHPQPQA
jgi:RNA polymerase sigma factor (TIGR02999 family)